MSLRSTRSFHRRQQSSLLTIGVAALACGVVAHHADMSLQLSPRDFRSPRVEPSPSRSPNSPSECWVCLVITGENTFRRHAIRRTMAAVPSAFPCFGRRRWSTASSFSHWRTGDLGRVAPWARRSLARQHLRYRLHPSGRRTALCSARRSTSQLSVALYLPTWRNHPQHGRRHRKHLHRFSSARPACNERFPTSWNKQRRPRHPYLPLPAGQAVMTLTRAPIGSRHGRAWASCPTIPPWPSAIASILLVHRDT